MRIIAIDPGYERLGIAIIDKATGGKETLVFSECFETSRDLEHGERLALVGNRVREAIAEHEPGACAIETLFFAKNQKTATKVAEVRGVILAEATRGGLPVFEYTPMQVKVAVTGYGKSDKGQVTFMTKKLLRVDKDALDDEYDAMAVGLTCFARERF
ncbi:MAG: crossover junction endodeoxyribonuclease RuvC [Candidatus Paceibacterota bacterium]|jgi:crossover junction endodeoxyribonuclease RuvC